MFTGNILQRLLAPDIISTPEITNDQDMIDSAKSDQNDLNISIIGPLLWSTEYFEDDSSRSSSFDETDQIDGPSLTAGSQSEIKVTDAIEEVVDDGLRKKRKTVPIKMTASQICYELSKPNVNPHLLISPHVYGDHFGAGAGCSQPFKIKVHPQVKLKLKLIEKYLITHACNAM